MFLRHHFKFARVAVFLSAIALAFPLTAFSMIAGRADFVVGKVEAVAANGAHRLLFKGSEINTGETINTDANARAQLRFTDGGFISLQPNTVFRVDEFNFQNKTDGGERSFFSLLKGGLRAITGAIGRVNRDTYRVTTPVATIGIRGTGYNAMLSDGLFVNVGEGAISLTNNAGLLLVSAGGAAFVANINTLPAPTTEQPNAPPAGLDTVYEYIYPVDQQIYTAGGDLGPGGVPTILPHLTSGSGYTMAYAYMQCGDGCYASGSGGLSDVTAHFNDLSQLQQYETAAEGGALGTATVSFAATDGVIGWGRWDGSTDVSPVNGGSSPHPLTAGTFHYVIGIPTSTATMPTGTATYALLGYTTPTATDGSTGWQFDGVLTADFTYLSVGVNLAVTNVTDTYLVSGSMPINGATFDSTLGTLTTTFASTNVGSLGCVGTAGCTTTINGFFAGDGASHAGLTYDIKDPGLNRDVLGAAAFISTGTIPSLPPQ